MSDVPTIVITSGDPAGIGPEVVFKSLTHSVPGVRFLVVGRERDYRSLCESLKHPLPFQTIIQDFSGLNSERGARRILLNVNAEGEAIPGSPSESTAEAAMQFLRTGLDLAIKGTVDAMTTAPVSKAWISRAGYSFRGHTDYLAGMTRTEYPVMFFYGQHVSVALATVHIPLRKVPGRISEERVCQTIRATWRTLRDDYNIDSPRIAVCGLNPHAGEEGFLGREDQTVITRSITTMRKASMEIRGPVPADSLFRERELSTFDAAVAMYHDQGLIPAKALNPVPPVNISLNLPFPRTSPDHGTAYDIAGKNLADAEPMRQAILHAVKLARNRRAAKTTLF